MAVGRYGIQVTVGAVNIQRTISRTADHSNTYEVSLDAAKPLSSWVKTDLDTAAGNLPGGHGYTNGTFDVYWTGGARYDVPGTIATNALSLDGGTGDDFPTSGNTTVVAYRQITINTAIDGDAIGLGAISLEYADESLTSRGRLLFEDATGDDIAPLTVTGNQPAVYDIAGGAANPFTGDPIVVCRASHENDSATATLKIVTVEDSTP
jgi:hypothetical protein